VIKTSLKRPEDQPEPERGSTAGSTGGGEKMDVRGSQSPRKKKKKFFTMTMGEKKKNRSRTIGEESRGEGVIFKTGPGENGWRTTVKKKGKRMMPRKYNGEEGGKTGIYWEVPALGEGRLNRK